MNKIQNMFPLFLKERSLNKSRLESSVLLTDLCSEIPMEFRFPVNSNTNILTYISPWKYV